MSDLEEALCFQIRAAGLPVPERQFKAVEGRKWRWDLAWPAQQLLLEVDGAIWIQGRHNRGRGIEGDAEKQSAAAATGWRTMRVTERMIDSGRAVELLEVALQGRHITSVGQSAAVKIQPGDLAGRY